MSELLYILIGIILIVGIGFGMAYITAYVMSVANYYDEDDVIKQPETEHRAVLKPEKHEPKNAGLNKGKAILKARRQGHISAFWHGDRFPTGLYYREDGK